MKGHTFISALRSGPLTSLHIWQSCIDQWIILYVNPKLATGFYLPKQNVSRSRGGILSECGQEENKGSTSRTRGAAWTLHKQSARHTHLHSCSERCINKKHAASCCSSLTLGAVQTSQVGSVQKERRILCLGVATATLSFSDWWLIYLPQCALI